MTQPPRRCDRSTSFGRTAPLRVALCALLLAGCTAGGPQGNGELAGRQDPATVAGGVSTAAVLGIAESLRATGDFASAISFYRRAIVLDPNQVRPYIGLGETLLATGHANEAAESFRAALAMAPTNADAMRGLGLTLVALDKPTEAVEMLNRSIKAGPSARAYSALGIADNLLGNAAAANEAFKQGLVLAPDDLDLLNNYGLSQALGGDYDAAIKTLHRVATDPKATSRNRLNLAMVLGLAGRSEDAAQVARIDLDEGSVRSNLAYYAELRGLSPEARAAAILRPGKPLVSHAAMASICDSPPCATPIIPEDKASAAPAIPVSSKQLAAATTEKPAAETAALTEHKPEAAPKHAKRVKKLAAAKPAAAPSKAEQTSTNEKPVPLMPREAAAPAAPAPEAEAKPAANPDRDASHDASTAAPDDAKPAVAEQAPLPAAPENDKPASAAADDKPASSVADTTPVKADNQPAPTPADAAPVPLAPAQATQANDTPAAEATPPQLAKLDAPEAAKPAQDPAQAPAGPAPSDDKPAAQKDAMPSDPAPGDAMAAAKPAETTPAPSVADAQHDAASDMPSAMPAPDATVPAASATPDAPPSDQTKSAASDAAPAPAGNADFVAATGEPGPVLPDASATPPADHPAMTGATVVAAAPAALAHPALGKHAPWIQLATFRSEQNAHEQLKATLSANKDLLRDLPLSVRRVDLGSEKGIYYLLRIGPVESVERARHLCSALKDRKIDCIVAK